MRRYFSAIYFVLTTALMTVAALLAAPAAPARASDGHGTPQQGRVGDGQGDALDSDIVVSAPRYGQARVDADREMDEAQIATFGAESIDDLLKRAAAWIEPFGDPPLLLINGKPIGYDQSILSYPAEALSRLEVLKDEARAEYGQGGGGRVINLVLKRSFSSLTMDVGYDQPTAGGASGQRLSAARTAIQGDMRWNANARVQRDTALMKSERNGQVMAGFFPAQAAVQTRDGSELDPILSDLVGRNLSAAALPDGRGPWLIDDFAADRDALQFINPAALENVSPKRQSASLSIGMARPIGDFQLSINLQANQSRNASWRGPAYAQLLWEADHFASPFSQDVDLLLPLAGHPALRVEGKNRGINAALNANGKVAGWQLGLGLNASRSWNENHLEQGVDNAALQQQWDAGAWNPADGVGSEWLRVSRSRGRQDTLAAQFNTSRSLWDGPAGPLNLSLSMNGNLSAAHRWIDGQALDPANRRFTMARASLSVPINRSGEGLLPVLGDLTLDLGASRQQVTGSSGQQSWSMGVNHQPWSWLQLRVSWDQSKSAPSADQLDGPQEENVQRVFDYARQEVTEVLWITGGNPSLREGTRDNMMLNATLRPWQPLSYDVNYRKSVARAAISSLPELTPIIEAAFGDRIWRDAEGRLLRIDARPINLDHQSDSQIGQNLTFNWTLPSSNMSGEAGWQLQASFGHQMRLTSVLKIREGVPIINQLSADSGQSRHSLNAHMGLSRSGLGVNLQGQWSSGGRLRLGGDQPDLHFKPPLTINMTAFVDMNKYSKSAFFKGLRMSADVQNLTRQYRRVTRSDGSVPAGYGRDDVDPVGRTMRITLRKRF